MSIHNQEAARSLRRSHSLSVGCGRKRLDGGNGFRFVCFTHRCQPSRMTENPTPAGEPAATAENRLQELIDAGVPEHLRPWLRQMGVGALVVKMGIKFVEMSAERIVATMPVLGNTQVAGILHGGAHVVMAETLGSFAASIHAGANRHAVGIEVGATHHRSVAAGLVTGTATALQLGRTLAVHEVVMTDEQGRRLSTARITNLIRDNA
jgi:1,4-dihydroxy-2-naphthoyl-CoA hydrolase